ncbi:hypothetical protein H0H92_012551 [Tricholoma furcatifolium]|nr:hypothetical protein H0H92_012551 [Tricholoma furcatifolium]
MAHRVWILVSSAYAVVEPHFRPLIRTGVIAALRLWIRWLPHIISGIYFEAHSTTATFPDLPGTSVSAGDITFHMNLSFTDLEKVVDTGIHNTPRSVRSKRSYGMAAWRKRFTASFQRTLDRAWGNTQGNVSISLKLHNISGLTLPVPPLAVKSAEFLHLPGAIDFEASMKFNPREGTPDNHSLAISLNIGDCSIEMDTLKLLLKNLKPKETRPPPALSLDGLVAPPMTFSPGSPSSFISPTSEIMDGFFSPQSWSMSPKSETSPTSALFSAGFMPSSPVSPFLERLSASIRPRRRHLYKPCTRLRDYKKQALLSILKQANIKITSVTLATENKWGLDPYELKIENIAMDSKICGSSLEDPFQTHCLGKRKKVENCDPDVYGFKFSVSQISVERHTNLDTMRLLSLDTLDLQVIISQWPAPWLTPSPFMFGDPNAPLLAIRTRVGGIEVTERLERLHEFFAHIEPSPKEESPSIPSTSFKLPRITFDVECGTLRARIICADTKNTEPFAVEVRNNGVVFSLASNFICDHKDCSRLTDHSGESLRMHYKFSLVLEPTLVRVRSKTKMDSRRFTELRSFDADFLDDPSILSIESFEFLGDGHAIASMNHDADVLPTVSTLSPILELHVSTDAICFEVWNPRVVTAIQQLSSIVPPQDHDPPPLPTKRPLLDRMPPGIWVTVAVPRIVVFLASPDINPQDTLDLSRGLALRTGLMINYSSLHSAHTHRFHNLNDRTAARQELSLPQQQLLDAVSAARASVITEKVSAHIKISFTNFTLRSAVSTQYDADNPFIFERDDPTFEKQEFLHIPDIFVNVCLSGKRGPSPSKSGDICEVSVVIPNVKATFHLGYVYSSMLAMQCLKGLFPKSPSNHVVHPKPEFSRSGLAIKFKVAIPTVQVFFKLRTQCMVLRVDGTEFHSFPTVLPTLQLNRAVMWVCLPRRINKWEDERGEKWEEFICLRSIQASLEASHGSPSISLKGESARLRIPYGYVFADFVADVIITVKAIRHLSHITPHHLYKPMPKPEPEEPKHVPKISVRLQCMCLEAEDDPFESNLAVIWRCGLDAAKPRMDRENAFQAKVAAIYQTESQVPPSGSTPGEEEYHFGGDHSVSLDEARRRLDEVHELDWTMRLQNLRQIQSKFEASINQHLRGKHSSKSDTDTRVPNLVEVAPVSSAPPLFRAMFNGMDLTIQQPSFPMKNLPDFLYEQGDGMPRDTQFSLLVPLHLNFALSSLLITLRDYPLPLFHVPASSDRSAPAWSFDTDLVIAEEMGSDLSVNWFDTPILEPHHGAREAAAFSFSVPRTIMSVKTYANPIVHVNTNDATIFSWNVSYAPAIQDLMRVIDTLTHPPLDPSPVIGFWDKMRLVFHWNLTASFKGDVRFHLKGSRDPHKLNHDGAGLVLSWSGNTKLLVAQKNEHRELIQVISDSMFIAIPNLEHLYPRNRQRFAAHRIPEASKPFRKIIAKARSGVRFGIGEIGEETGCSQNQGKSSGFASRLEVTNRLEQSPQDSYNGFRSDFIHLSTSLTSSTQTASLGLNQDPSTMHLTPKAFAHFWAWWALFDNVLSLPTRQGSYYPHRTISPKFGRHLATLKYRLHIRHLFVMHAYMDESRESWADGVTPWIGVKGMIEELHADLHQRDEETVVPDKKKVLRRKHLYAAEVSLRGVDLRALLATFDEPLRKEVKMVAPPQRSNYRSHKHLPTTPPVSMWFDITDFIETDWTPSTPPALHLLPALTCPQFTYFRRHSVLPHNTTLMSKFGAEGSHACLLGKSLTNVMKAVPRVQVDIAEARIRELRRLTRSKRSQSDDNRRAILEKMISLLEDYVSHLRDLDAGLCDHPTSPEKTYHLPSYTVSPDEWAEFENVYQIHCPKVFMDSAIRDVALQYYYCSRARKGLEYHMATRAVKFIRDQAEAAIDDDSDSEESIEKSWEGADTAQMAAAALKKIFRVDPGKPAVQISTEKSTTTGIHETFDALDGWSESVSLHKSIFCLLLKPQIVLRGEDSRDSLVVAAVQARLQTFAIMDNNNIDDPISGKVMSRSHSSVNGLQAFSPSSSASSDTACVPFEVLIDLRCESAIFDQLVPQTDAIFHYDKFNRLRLRNNVTSVKRACSESDSSARDNHLQDETDLIRVHIPRFTVSANDDHFQAISNVITHLLLFSDAAHKTRLEKLETLLFTYDFTDLASAAKVVANLQSRLNEAHEAQMTAEYNHSRKLDEKEGQLELLKLKAHIFLLSEELNFLFDAIKLAQDRHDDHSDRKSALLLAASSDEISWKMLDDRRELLSKLVVQNISFYWLSRQDSSTSNDLSVRNLQAFDGSRYAIWPEIVSKHDEPANHPLLKRGLFLIASWTVLAPVGGITIYESFEMSLHPIRLQIDARVGRRIMEYLWPARKHRQTMNENDSRPTVDQRISLDSPRTLHAGHKPPREATTGHLAPPLRRLGASRSFTDLRGSAKEALSVPALNKMPSSESLRKATLVAETEHSKAKGKSTKSDAAEMKTRTSQRSFVLVKISSMNLLLSIVKEGSFECHDARIKTRDLEYRNQTWSPLLPVFPVARELLSKTRWIPSSTKTVTEFDVHGPPPKLPRARALSEDDDKKLVRAQSTKQAKVKSPGGRRGSLRIQEPPPPHITSLPFTDEPESLALDALPVPEIEKPAGRKRVLSIFTRKASKASSAGSSSSTIRRSDEK